MAANKFATMIHRNTNKITVVLVYAVLEWTLILLLLLHSLFSSLILKFSHFFSLNPPCFWCSTLHCFLKPQNTNSHLDLLCELHSKQVSVLGFCPNHKKLAEIKDLCEDCFSSHLDFQSELKQSDEEEEEEEEENLKCSCCGLKVYRKRIDDLLLTRISSDVLEYTKNGNPGIGSDDRIGSVERKGDSGSDFVPQDLEFFFDYSGNQLVPIELVDSEESQNVSEADEECEFGDYQIAQAIQHHQHKTVIESMELEETENSLVFHAKMQENPAIVEGTRPLFIHNEELKENDVQTHHFEPGTHFGNVLMSFPTPWI